MASAYRKGFNHGSRAISGDSAILCRTGSGKTLIAPGPVFDPDLAYSDGQDRHQAAVRDAARFAALAATEDIYVLRAQGSGVTAYALAFTDWFGTPDVLEINMDAWTGQPGQTILVKARDNVGVSRVFLTIRDARGALLESGPAEQSAPESAWWAYRTRLRVETVPFPEVQAIAFDRPGNRGSFTTS